MILCVTVCIEGGIQGPGHLTEVLCLWSTPKALKLLFKRIIAYVPTNIMDFAALTFRPSGTIFIVHMVHFLKWSVWIYISGSIIKVSHNLVSIVGKLSNSNLEMFFFWYHAY